MALVDQVKEICDKLAPLGWSGLLKAITSPVLDIEQKTPVSLQKALTAPLTKISRTVPGFEDFDPAGQRGITTGEPSQSLLYHALASPRLVRDADSGTPGTGARECPLKSILRPRDRVPLPHIFQSFGQGLLFDGAVGVPGVTRKYKLIVIAFGGQHSGHILVGQDPVVHVVAHHIGIEIVPVTHFHPDA